MTYQNYLISGHEIMRLKAIRKVYDCTLRAAIVINREYDMYKDEILDVLVDFYENQYYIEFK